MKTKGIAQFEKVSFNQWKNDVLSGDFKDIYSRFPEKEMKKIRNINKDDKIFLIFYNMY